MRKLSILAAALAAAATIPGTANAVLCYEVLDRGDTLIYRDSVPPFDMSEQGAGEREDMRRRSEYLTISEVEHCPPVAAPPGTTGYRAATVDEIVAGMRALPTGGGAVRGGGAGAPVRSGQGAASSPARSGSSTTRRY